MKRLLFAVLLLISCVSIAQEVHMVTKGVITGDFTVELVDKGIVLRPNQEFSMSDLNLTEYHRSPKSWKKIGREHIAWPVIGASYTGGAGIVGIITGVPLLSAPLFAFSALYIHRASIRATNTYMNKVSQRILLTKPGGRKYEGKIAFFKVHKRCGKEDVGKVYNISMSDDRLSKLDDGTYTDIAEYEYCSKHDRVTWVIWDLKKAKH